jgi:PII-like signaling protein
VDEDGIELTGYFRERQRTGGRPLGEALIELYGRRRVAASILLRGIEGLGSDQPSRAGRTLPLSDDAPLTAVAVDTRANLHALLDETLRLAGPQLVAVQQARLLSGEVDPVRLAADPGEAARLTLYCGHHDRVYQVPAFEAACEMLFRRGIGGATVLSGTAGTFRGQRQHAPLVRRHAHAPLMIIAVGAEDRIGMVLPEIAGLFRHPLMTVAKVSLCKRDGHLIGRPRLAPGDPGPSDFGPGDPGPADFGPGDFDGLTAVIRLTVYTSEAARHDGWPVHRAILHRLRTTGIGGATAQRGIWGYHGDHAPHGDHFPRLGHHVPVITTVIGTPERIAAAFDVIDPLTAGRGLVTAETVLTMNHAAIAHE